MPVLHTGCEYWHTYPEICRESCAGEMIGILSVKGTGKLLCFMPVLGVMSAGWGVCKSCLYCLYKPSFPAYLERIRKKDANPKNVPYRSFLLHCIASLFRSPLPVRSPVPPQPSTHNICVFFFLLINVDCRQSFREKFFFATDHAWDVCWAVGYSHYINTRFAMSAFPVRIFGCSLSWCVSFYQIDGEKNGCHGGGLKGVCWFAYLSPSMVIYTHSPAFAMNAQCERNI